ncbi:MAG: DUF1778 domain-containing protein [Proteobacteria bacterium]|nr:DUF1778 domain-containing protein [Pseudomonadota bacterium]
MPTITAKKDIRIGVRTTTEIQETIQRASKYLGTSVSQFLIDTALEKAIDVIETAETIKLTNKGADAMMALLNNPPVPNKSLIDSFQKYQENVSVS